MKKTANTTSTKTTSNYKNPWVFKGEEFHTEQINGYHGFVYCITNLLDGRKYIGRKYFFTDRRNPKGKGKRRIRKETDWKEYYGSNEELKQDVQRLGTHNFRRVILSLHKTKGMTNYTEIAEQIKRDVIFDENYYNLSVNGKYYGIKKDESEYNDE